MSQFWSPIAKQLEPYVPGEQPQETDLIKINTNESPYGPSPKVLEAIRRATDDNLRLYPDPESKLLRGKIAQHYGLSIREVFVGNGSDEILAHTFMGLFNPHLPILSPQLSYSFYPVYAKLYGLRLNQIPMGHEMAINIEDYIEPNGGVIIANPNAPTGRAIDLKKIEKLIQNNDKSVVVIDEAYVDFGTDSAAELVAKYSNLLVIQTLSKSWGLAGMRVGFALGHEALIEGLQRVKNSFNSYPLDRLAQVAAVAAFDDREYMVTVTQKIMHSRERLSQAMREMGFEVIPSQANFILVSHNDYKTAPHYAMELAVKLRQRKILVRFFNTAKMRNYLRISIGKGSDVERLIRALREILSL